MSSEATSSIPAPQEHSPSTSTLNTSQIHSEELPSRLGINAFLRGFQLSIVGTYRALLNPDLFTLDHYQQAAYAVAIGLSLYLFLLFPLFLIRASVWATSLFVDLDNAGWSEDLVDAVNFIEHHVLALPFLIMTTLRHIYPQPLDELFMQSLEWTDRIYTEKHARDDKSTLRPLYHKTLSLYARSSSPRSTQRFSKFVRRTIKRLLLGIVLLFLSLIPGIGKSVYPAAGFYSLYRALGEDLFLAAIVSGLGLLLFPKRVYIILIQGWLSSRALTRELLEPYFARINFTDEEKREWFHEREVVLLGFGLAFYLAVRLPLIGPLIYGIATASAAYALTKITDPPPPPVYGAGYPASQTKWVNKTRFLSLPHKDAFSVEYEMQGRELNNPKDE